jgi:4a-hydroxytetrahydrobiopterin dehydratase
MTTPLADRACVPCRGGVPPLTAGQIAPLLAQLPSWKVVDDHHLETTYRVKNFVAALDLVNRIGAIAEEQNHHPDLSLAWGRVGVTIWTHKIDGLTESDFIFAAKCDRAFAAIHRLTPNPSTP